MAAIKKTSRKKNTDFPIIGIGASAGGLEALTGFISNLNSQSNVAFVIIQHRATEHKSIMISLLEKHTKLKVLEIENDTEINPGCIYINPPHNDITISNGKLYCEEGTYALGVRLPIDHFFKSLAQDKGERSICIILSGTGTDGTLGMKEIKAAGGMSMAQDEQQAKYPAMPRNAIDTGLVDFILPVEKMPEQLIKYIKHSNLELSEKQVTGEGKFENFLQQIFKIVRRETGHDFTNYKRNTIRRRIERRMAIHQIAEFDVYIKYLKSNAPEIKMLFKDLIITVTNFFRDPEAFYALKEKVVKEIVRKKQINSPIRIWVAGCATGEEAYSLTILFEEAMEELEKRHEMQVFATDIDEESVEIARYGRYPDSISADVSKPRLKKFFNKLDNGYKIKEQVREKLVFAKQDLIKDPPFSRLDLVCCRNVLIYMDSELQKKIIQMFHYVLNPDGFLFLGTSETIGQYSDLFASVENKQKLFKRKTQFIKHYEYPAIPNISDFTGESQKSGKEIKHEIDIKNFAKKLILNEYSPPCVFINDKYDIIYFHGETDAFLIQPGGEPTTNIIKMAKKEIHYPISVLLHKAERERKILKSDMLEVKYNGDILSFYIIVRPLKEPTIKKNLFMIVFDVRPEQEKQSQKSQKDDKTETKIEQRNKILEQELASTKEYLQTTIEELETSNEELKSSNEELQSTNEELQSTNEELETSREELQSTNEELRTINTEHQSKIDELARANDDLNNLLASTNIATIFLDTDLRIKRFTPESKNIFKFIDSDMGRPLDNIVNKLEYENLEQDAQSVLDTLTKIEHEVKTKDGRWLRINIAPYRTTENLINGVVIIAFDISKEKEIQDYAESIVETIRQPLLVLDNELRVISANKAFYQKFKVDMEKTTGKLVYDLGNRQWDIPELRRLLEDILSNNTSFEDFKVEQDFPDIGRMTLFLNARRIIQERIQTQKILLAIEEIQNDS